MRRRRSQEALPFFSNSTMTKLHFRRVGSFMTRFMNGSTATAMMLAIVDENSLDVVQLLM
jgi:hypothetical protein